MMTNVYGPYTLFDLGLTDPAIIESLNLYNHPQITAGGFPGLGALTGLSSGNRDASPPRHRHDGTSPLPLGMDWSPPPRVWDGQNTVWPHDFHTGWSYCVTIPSWKLSSESSASESVVLYEVLVGIQSPQGITTTRGIQRRFSDFVTLSSDLRKEFPNKKLPPAPRRGLMRIKSSDLLEERRRLLEDWMTEVLSDIDFSRSLSVAIFIELEAAVRSSFNESNNNVPDEGSPISGVVVQPVEFPNIPNNNWTTSSPELPNVAGALETLDEPPDLNIQSSKVKDLETEAESAEQSSEGNMQQPVLTEKEQLTKMLGDMDELRRKCLETEASLKAEQDKKLQAVSTNRFLLQENEKLRQELDAAHQQLENLQKHKTSDLDSKTDRELLVKEVESLRSSNSEMTQELSILTKQKTEVEAILHEERQSREQTDSVNAKLLQQCMILRTRLEECSVNFQIDSENKLIMDTPTPSDPIDISVTSDNQIGLLLAEVELLAQDVVTSNGDNSRTRNTELRKVLTDLLTDSARLRKQVNSVIRCALSPPTRSEKDEEDSTPRKTVPHSEE
ncbi:PX domain-containing protein EREL1-like [Ipomoea triloba]|uniref:PX domain-containing protein EREL1-like n=1 Tax=Ipomoea triloba TaxID=35885 RepID=UPI00125D7332|nr:PX domain-containing protein EREL1-like [Ipomoea triloba]